MSTFEQGYIAGIPVNMPVTHGSGNTQFQAVLTSTGPFTSTLTTTAHIYCPGWDHGDVFS